MNALSSSKPSTEGLSVCIVTDTFVPDINGVAMTLSRLTEGLSERGHRVHLVGPGWATNGDVFHQSVLKSVPLPLYPDVRLGLATVGTFQRLWRRHRPDVVYVATEGMSGLSAVRQARRLGVPVVSGFHTNFHSYSGQYRLGLLKGVLLRYLRALHNRTHCTVVPSDDVEIALSKEGFANLKVMGRGVDCGLFAPARRDPELRASWGLSENALAVLYVGRVAAEKNLKLALRAFQAIQERRQEARFVVVGDGPMARKLKRDHSRATFCGMRRGVDLARHYASGDVLLFPSETETFGNVTTEGMASGLGVVAYDYAAARSYIRSGVNGMTAPYRDEDAYVAQAVDLAINGDLLTRVRSAARTTATRLSWSAVTERFEHLLMQSMNGTRMEEQP